MCLLIRLSSVSLVVWASAPRFRLRTIVLDRAQSYSRSRYGRLLSIPIAEYPYGRAFNPFPKFKSSKLIAVTSGQLVLPRLDLARRCRSIPELPATRPVRKCRTANFFPVRIRSGERGYG